MNGDNFFSNIKPLMAFLNEFHDDLSNLHFYDLENGEILHRLLY